MILLVLLCQTLVYREVTALFSLKTATPESRNAEGLKGKDPWSKTLNWYFFAVTNYFLYGESIIYYFKVVFGFPCLFRAKLIHTYTACRVCGCQSASFCNKPPYDQFYAVHHWVHGFCDVIEERISQTTVWPLLLGSHDFTVDCRIKVCRSLDASLVKD